MKEGFYWYSLGTESEKKIPRGSDSFTIVQCLILFVWDPRTTPESDKVSRPGDQLTYFGIESGVHRSGRSGLYRSQCSTAMGKFYVSFFSSMNIKVVS